MVPHDGSSLSPLVTGIAAVLTAIGIAFAGLRTYFKERKERKEPAGRNDVVLASATFADRKTVEKFIDALERNETASNRAVQSNHELVDEVRRLCKSIDGCTDEVRTSTHTILNLATWLESRPGK